MSWNPFRKSFWRNITQILRRGSKSTYRKRAIFAGAAQGDIYGSWTTANWSSSSEISTDLAKLRARSRELHRNNPFAKRFAAILRTNVVGPDGITLRAKVTNDAGQLEKDANSKIESAWQDWCRRGHCDVTGQYSFRELCNIAISAVEADGEVLLRIHKQKEFKYRFALELLDADHLDIMHNDILPTGNKIEMGIEYNAHGRPVAYHITDINPNDRASLLPRKRLRIPADEMIHLFRPERPGQPRGLPWMHAVMNDLKMLGAYIEAEIVAARTAAAKMGFLSRKEGASQYTGTDANEADTVEPVQEVSPGIIEQLPDGYSFEPWDPTHPTTAFDSFTKTVLRAVASGIDVSYSTLTGDLTDVNYSSIRAGMLAERDHFRNLQTWFIEWFLLPVFEEWLYLAIMFNHINLPLEKFEKFNKVKFVPRGFSWVDPEKEINARTKEIEAGLNSEIRASAELGRDYEEIIAEQEQAQKIRDKHNLKSKEAA